MPAHLLDRISIVPGVMTGKPVIHGTRIPVELIVRMVAQGIPIAEILADYPRLTAEDVQAALWYAAAAVANEDIFPLSLDAA
jgi:uncharacterized protein (DUF433 family)